MLIGDFDTNTSVFVIAEIGNNHEGSYALAEEMIGKAKEAGANAVKLQTIVPEKLVSVQQQKRIEQLKKFQLSYQQFEKLSKVAKDNNITFLSTPFDLESAKFLNQIVPAYKIASGDNTFFPLLKTVAQTAKPIIISTGITELQEVVKTKDYIEQIWKEHNIKQEIAFLHCVVSYPTPPEEANLSVIRTLKNNFNCTIGYSDHVIGVEAAVLSIALGARIVEKHFTIDKNYSNFRDHQLSADPQELAEMIKRIRAAEKILGNSEKVVKSPEKLSLEPVRRSIVAARNLTVGSKITWEDISWVRPGTGLSPGEESKVIGQKLAQDILQGEIITLEMLKS